MSTSDRTATGELIKIKVAKTIVEIHRDLLLGSEFFANALKPEWVAMRGDNPIDLTEEKMSTFRHYKNWLYNDSIKDKCYFERMASMYVLGEKLLDRGFQDAVLSTMMERCDGGETFPSYETVEIIYRGTPKDSPARRLLSDVHCWAGNRHWMEEMDLKNTEFIRDLLELLLDDRDAPLGEYPWIDSPSMYLHGVKAAGGVMAPVNGVAVGRDLNL